MEYTGLDLLHIPYEEPEKAKVDLSELNKAIAANPAPTQQYVPQGYVNIPAVTGADSGALFNLFSGIDKMDDRALYDLVAKTYDAVLSYGRPNAPKEEIGVIWNLFNNVKYVMTLSLVLSQNTISYDQKLCCNKIIYDYMVTSNKNKNPLVQQALDQLSSVVNADVITALSGITLPEGSKTAAQIGVCIHSSQSYIIGVKRLNCFMINSENKMYTEELVFDMYEKLYYNCLTHLVEGVMFDQYDNETLANLSDTAKDIYYIQNLAILDILDQAPQSVIQQVLSSYALDFYNFGGGKKRFSLVVDPVDYSNIDAAITALNARAVYVP